MSLKILARTCAYVVSTYTTPGEIFMLARIPNLFSSLFDSTKIAQSSKILCRAQLYRPCSCSCSTVGHTTIQQTLHPSIHPSIRSSIRLFKVEHYMQSVHPPYTTKTACTIYTIYFIVHVGAYTIYEH